MNKYIMIMLLIFMTGCMKDPDFTPFKPEPIQFKTVEKYNLQKDLSNIPDIKKPELLYGNYISCDDESLPDEVCIKLVKDTSKADVFVLLPKEYLKTVTLKTSHDMYKVITFKQKDLINLKINHINEFQRLVKMTERERDIAIGAWTNSENAYRKEKAHHELDNKVNSVLMYIVTIGSVILVSIL